MTVRKNGINRELRPIEGGVCAPKGFRAGGVYCGLSSDPNKPDIALIVAERRCPTACVYSVDSKNSATVKVTKQNLKNGLASAIFVNSGIANVFLPNGEELAVKTTRLLATYAGVDARETVIASTGKVGKALHLEPFKQGIPTLVKRLSATEAGSLLAAEAIMTADKAPKHCSFSFDLGDVPCKIGAIFKGSARVCPNMATTLAFLTTDVNITPEILQKALSAAARDTFNLLCVDGISSPNDTVCVMANGAAGNYKISQEDSDYAKFLYVLKEVLAEICRRIVTDADEGEKAFVCKVNGAKSKQIARFVAKTLVSSQTVRDFILNGAIPMESALFAINGAVQETDFSKLSVRICGKGEYLLYEDGRSIGAKRENLSALTEASEITLFVSLGTGNYSATAFGCFKPRKEGTE